MLRHCCIVIQSYRTFLLTQRSNSSNVPQMAPTVWRKYSSVLSALHVETLDSFSWRIRAQETLEIGQMSEGLGAQLEVNRSDTAD